MRGLRLLITASIVGAATTAGGEVRVITAPGVPVFAQPAQPPQRVAPPQRPSAPPAQMVTRRFAPVVVEDAATLMAGGLRLIQPGVAPLGPDETCRDDAGVEWSCGRRMLSALRGFVRMRPVDCDVPKDARRGRFETACRLGEADFGDVAIRQGWARALPDGPYGAAADEARRERRGLFGPAPTSVPVAPELVADPSSEPPADTTLAPLGGGETSAAAPTADTLATRRPMAPSASGTPMRLGR